MKRPFLGGVVAAAIVAALLLVAGAFAGERRGVPAWTLGAQVLEQLNEVRAEHGLGPLEPSASLTAAADEHSTEMIAEGYFGHESADGSAFSKRIERYYRPARFKTWGAGENLLESDGRPGADRVVESWLASPEHRAIMLSPRWREVGISAVYSPPAARDGLGLTVVTVDFGFRV